MSGRRTDAFPSFAPSAAGGTAARRGVSARLGESLAHIFEQAASAVAFDRGAADALVVALGAGVRFPPDLFARYFELVDAIEADDDAAIRSGFDRLLEVRPDQVDRLEPRLVLFGDEALPGHTATIRRHFSLDDLDGAQIEAVAPADRAAAVERFTAALALLAEAAPRTHAEVVATLSEIVLARGVPGGNGYTFDGASSLRYWGAIMVNVANRKSVMETGEMIAHEAAHNALFGMSPRSFFVENGEDERYTSPLRDDPRPLDGIFHATFVLARMHYAVAEMVASGRLDTAGAGEAGRLLKRSAENFAAGAGVLAAHARFTGEGRAIFDAARSYMAGRSTA